MANSSDNKRIAINTVLLYIRTFIVLAVSLYSSRLILKALGVDDLGIYNVVGGIVLLMSSFRTTLSRSTSRFITYEIGNGGDNKILNRVFSSAMTIHLIIAGVAIILGETIGLIILKEWTAIPESRLFAALVVYQCSLLVFALQVLISPFESVVIAHENMTVYAYMSVLSAVLKLSIIIILFFGDYDRLILYGILLVLMDFTLLAIYYIYTRNKYLFINLNLIWDSSCSRKMLSFSGWTLLGSSANAATQQGVSLLFNNFIGLVANAALGFAGQVNSALQTFVGSFQTAFNPQVIKLYAQNNLPQMRLLMIRASKFSFMLAYVVALPLIFNMRFVLEVWLGDVPQYTIEFCQLILACCVIDATTGVLNTGITATGNIKGFQMGITVSFVLDLVTSSILLCLHFSPIFVFASRIITRGLLNMVIEIFFVRKQLDFSARQYAKEVLIPIVFVIILTAPAMFLLAHNFNDWQGVFMSSTVSVISCAIITLLILLNKNERKIVVSSIINIIRKI